MRKCEKPHRSVVNNFYGNINNFYSNSVRFDAPVSNYNTGDCTMQTSDYSDKQVAQALERITGKGKPLDTKQKWAAVYWLLRWQCNYPVKGTEFCERIAGLPFTNELEIKCEYNNIRSLSTLSFMNEDPRQIDKVRYSKNDEQVFFQMREVVRALSHELQNTYSRNIGF